MLPPRYFALLPEAGSGAQAAAGERQSDRRRHVLISGGLDTQIDLGPKRAKSVRRRKVAVAAKIPADVPAKSA